MRTLQQWEETLRRQVVGGNVLLGQLPLGQPPYNDVDMNELGRLLNLRFKKTESVYRRLQIIEEESPLSLALFLVLHGVYSYEKGEYWPEPCHRLGIPYEGNHTAALGRAFRRVLGRFQLPTFAHIEGQENLVPILAHGGIPNYSLGDFFHLLEKSVRGSWIRVDAETLIEEWDRDPERAFLWIDRPVQRFVLHGGAIAIDFVDECISLVTGQGTEAVAGLELPRRVIDAYEEWRERSGNEQISVSQIRLRRPVLYIDPWGQGVAVELPAPFFPLGQGVESLHWEIVAGSNSFEMATDRQRMAEGYEYHAFDDFHPPVASAYEIRLRSEDGIIRTWTIDGLDEAPLLMFDPDTWSLLSKNEFSRPGERWVLYPRDGTLRVEDGRMTTEFPPLYGEWSRYCVEEWIIPAGGTVTLHVPEKDPYQLEISEELNLRRPRLVGGDKPLTHLVNPRFPLYAGAPPGLKITFVQEPDQTQLKRWHISIRPEGKTRPSQPVAHSLNTLTDHLRFFDDGSVVLDFSAPQLLGSKPMGKFEIHAKGPFGQSRRLGLRIVPHLRVIGDKKHYLDRVDAEAELRIICDIHSTLELHSQEPGIECTPQSVAPNYYEVSAPSSVHTLKFSINSAGNIKVPFSIQLRRLRWALCEGKDTQNLLWQTSPLKLYPDTLADVYNAELYIELPPFIEDEKLYGGWRLVDSHDRVWAERPPDLERSRRQYIIKIPELLSEYRQARERDEMLRLQIWVNRDCSDFTEHFVDALYLLPSYEVQEITCEWQQTAQGVTLSLSWQEPMPGRNRMLFLWPADEPWIEKPRQVHIQGDSLLGCEVFIPNFFGASDYRGDYLATIEIKSPWDSQIPQRPEPGQRNTFIVSPAEATSYYSALRQTQNGGGASAEEMLILLHHFYRVGTTDKMHETNQRVREAAKGGQLKLEQLVLWAELTQAIDPIAYKLAKRFTLFSLQTVEELEQRAVSESWRQRYFAHLPTDFSKQSEIYEYLLAADFSEARQKSIAGLCRLGRRAGIEELLDDVENGRILAREAVEFLLPSVEKVTQHLVNKGSADALKLLSLLAERSPASISWVQPGFWLRTEIGEGEVQSLIAVTTGEPIDCCGLNDPALATINGNSGSGQPPFLLDLSARVVQIQAEEAYQCSHCQHIFASPANVVGHHCKDNPAGKLQFRRLRGADTIFAIRDLAVEIERA